MNKLLVTLVVSLSFIVNAEAQAWQWAVSAGGSSFDLANDVYTDATGNSYITGWYQNTVNFGPSTLTSTGGYDLFVAKYNVNGVCQWASGTGAAGNDIGYGVCADASGNVYVTGTFTGTVMFGTTQLISNNGSGDVFVAKYDASGNPVWAVSGGGTLDDQGQAITLNGAGVIVVNGYYKGTGTFGLNSIVSAGSSDVFTGTVSSTGVWNWVRTGGGVSGDNGYGVTTDANNNVYITGYFRTAATFGSFNLTSAGLDDVFVVKYGQTGACLFASSGGGTADDHGNGIVSDGAGNTYLTGWFKGGAAAFGTHNVTATSASEEAFIAKYNTSGVAQWAFGEGGSGVEIATGICLDNTQSPVISGLYNTTFSIGSSLLTAIGNGDIFVAKFNSSGAPQWARYAGGSGNDAAYKISSDASGNIYTAGSFYNTCSFGLNNVVSNGIADIFVAKLNSTMSVSVNDLSEISNISIFPNPIENEFTVSGLGNSLVDLKLYDVLGNEIKEWKDIADGAQLQTDHLSSGIYFYRMSASGQLIGSGKMIMK